MPGGGERLTSEQPVMVIDDGGDVEILVGIDAADDKGASGARRDLHCSSPDDGMP
jgi:hypothetical protein